LLHILHFLHQIKITSKRKAVFISKFYVRILHLSKLKNIMKKINLLLLLCLTISFFSCSKNDDNLSPNNSIVGKWELIKQSDYLGGGNPSQLVQCTILLTFKSNQTLFAENIPIFNSCGNKNGEYSINGSVLNITTIDDEDNTPFTDEYNVLKLNEKTLIIQPFGYSWGEEKRVIAPEERDIFEFIRIN